MDGQCESCILIIFIGIVTNGTTLFFEVIIFFPPPQLLVLLHGYGQVDQRAEYMIFISSSSFVF